MAHFPPDYADAAIQACLEALDDVRQLRQVAGQRQPMNLLNCGFGLSEGEVIQGNIGSTIKMDYTVLGDTVNLAAEALTRKRPYSVSHLTSLAPFGNMAAYRGAPTALWELPRDFGRSYKIAEETAVIGLVGFLHFVRLRAPQNSLGLWVCSPITTNRPWRLPRGPRLTAWLAARFSLGHARSCASGRAAE